MALFAAKNVSQLRLEIKTLGYFEAIRVKERLNAILRKEGMMLRNTAKKRLYFASTATKMQISNKAAAASFNKLGLSIARTSQVLRSARTQVGRLEHAFIKFRLIAARVMHALGTFFIIYGLQRLIVGFAKSIVTANAQLEMMAKQLQILYKSADQVAKVMAYLKEYAIITPFRIQDLIRSTVTLKAFALDVMKYTKAVGDWSSAIGRDVKDMAVAFGKIAIGTPRTAMLLATRGLTMTEFKQYLGKFKDRAEALNALIMDHFGGMAEGMSRTFLGFLSNISDAWFLIAATIGEGLFQVIRSDAEAVHSWLRKLVGNRAALEKFKEPIRAVYMFLRRWVLQLVDIIIGIGKVTMALSKVRGVGMALEAVLVFVMLAFIRSLVLAIIKVKSLKLALVGIGAFMGANWWALALTGVAIVIGHLINKHREQKEELRQIHRIYESIGELRLKGGPLALLAVELELREKIKSIQDEIMVGEKKRPIVIDVGQEISRGLEKVPKIATSIWGKMANTFKKVPDAVDKGIARINESIKKMQKFTPFNVLKDILVPPKVAILPPGPSREMIERVNLMIAQYKELDHVILEYGDSWKMTKTVMQKIADLEDENIAKLQLRVQFMEQARKESEARLYASQRVYDMIQHLSTLVEARKVGAEWGMQREEAEKYGNALKKFVEWYQNANNLTIEQVKEKHQLMLKGLEINDEELAVLKFLFSLREKEKKADTSYWQSRLRYWEQYVNKELQSINKIAQHRYDTYQWTTKEYVRFLAHRLSALQKYTAISLGMTNAEKKAEEELLKYQMQKLEGARSITAAIEQEGKRINRELERWRETFAKTLVKATTDYLTALAMIPFEIEAAQMKLDEQLATERFRLDVLRGIREEKTDEQRIVERIYELEEERANVVYAKIRAAAAALLKTIIKTVVQMVVQRLFAIAITKEKEKQNKLEIASFGMEIATLFVAKQKLKIAEQRYIKEKQIAIVQAAVMAAVGDLAGAGIIATGIALAEAQALKQAAGISAPEGAEMGGAKQYGMDSWVNRPTWFLAGEAGPERVTVSPTGEEERPIIQIMGPVYNWENFKDQVRMANVEIEMIK